MSLNTLKVATEGYLKRNTKALLVIAVAGYLNFGGTPPTPEPSNGGGGNGSGSGGVNTEISTWGKTSNTDKELQEKIKLDDDLVFHIIKIWVEKCQT